MIKTDRGHQADGDKLSKWFEWFRKKSGPNELETAIPFIEQNVSKRSSEAANEILELNVTQNQEERLRWSNGFEYLLSILGFVIDLGNVSSLYFALVVF